MKLFTTWKLFRAGISGFGSSALGFVAKYAFKAVLGVAAALLVAVLWQRGTISGLEKDIEGLSGDLALQKLAAEHNLREFQQCERVNLANANEAERQRVAALEAEQRAKMLAAEIDQRVIVIPTQAEDFKDETCRTLDEPLPADFVDWLRDT